jgi:hypothetical protein
MATCGFAAPQLPSAIEKALEPGRGDRSLPVLRACGFGLTREQAAAKVYLVSESVNFSGHEVIAQLLRLKNRFGLGFLASVIVSKPVAPLAALGL